MRSEWASRAVESPPWIAGKASTRPRRTATPRAAIRRRSRAGSHSGRMLSPFRGPAMGVEEAVSTRPAERNTLCRTGLTACYTPPRKIVEGTHERLARAPGSDGRAEGQGARPPRALSRHGGPRGEGGERSLRLQARRGRDPDP